MAAGKNGEPSWKWRRGLTIAAVVFCGWRMMALEGAPDTRVNDTLAFGYQVLFAALVLIYSGSATAQDIAAIWATRSGTPYAPPPVPDAGLDPLPPQSIPPGAAG